MQVIVIADQTTENAERFDAHIVAENWREASPHTEVIAFPFAANQSAVRGVWEFHERRAGGSTGTKILTPDVKVEGWQRTLAHAMLSAVAQESTRIVIALPRYAYPDSGVELLLELLSAGRETQTQSADLLANPHEYIGAVQELSQLFRTVDLVITHTENVPLTGMHGMSGTAGLLGDLSQDESQARERVNATLLHGLDKIGLPATSSRSLLSTAPNTTSAKELARHDAAGAAGGLGFALLALGARALPLNQALSGQFNLPQAIAGADLLVVKQEVVDGRTFAHSTLGIVTSHALKYAVPVIALTGEQIMSTRELAASGVSACYTIPPQELVTMSGRLARSWSPNR